MRRSVDLQLEKVERLLGAEGRVALLRVRRADWEARTLVEAGDDQLLSHVGRGTTPADALANLVAELER